MNKVLLEINRVKELINSGERLILAGDKNLLDQLPRGNWIAGTIPYFMGEKGGVSTRDYIYVTKIPDIINEIKICEYNEDNVHNVYKEAFKNGLSIVILPAFSSVHLKFALKAPDFAGFATTPLIGWIAGFHLDDIATASAAAYNGAVGSNGSSAVVMHLSLSSDKYAEIDIINLFSQGNGDTLTFEEDGFSFSHALVNGVRTPLVEYVKKNNLDIRLPLVADYAGAMINCSFQAVDEVKGVVHFYAPLFKGISYKQAAPVGDYVNEFTGLLPKDGTEAIFFSCNCILNYLYAGLEGRKTPGVTGPITFGEVAYQLLNQTFTYVNIKSR